MLIETARDRGFGAIAITDHNEVSGAKEAAEVVEEMDDFKIIVAEEVMTGDAGEVIGLFLKEKIPKGTSMTDTIKEIKRQGGLVYVPHPFDRLHSVPDYENLLDIVEDIDLMEVFNPRVAISSFNEEAERFARKYNMIPAAGSDNHVAQGLGSVRNRLHDFDGPEEFLEVDAGRRDHPPPQESRLRPGAEVHPDHRPAQGRQTHGRRSPGGQGRHVARPVDQNVQQARADAWAR